MDPRHRQDQHWAEYPPSAHHPHHSPHPQDLSSGGGPSPSHPHAPPPPPGSWPHPHSYQQHPHQLQHPHQPPPPHPHPHPHMVHVSYPPAGSPPPPPSGVYLTPIHYNVASYPPPEYYKSVPARQRSTIACLSCRKRKIRCEQREDGRCENCLRINQTCEFVPVSSQKVAHGSFYKSGSGGAGPNLQSPTGPPDGYPPAVHHGGGYPPSGGVGPPPPQTGSGPGSYPPPSHNRHPSGAPPPSSGSEGHGGPGGYPTHLPPPSGMYPPPPPGSQGSSNAPPPPHLHPHQHHHTLPSPHDLHHPSSSHSPSTPVSRPLHEMSVNVSQQPGGHHQSHGGYSHGHSPHGLPLPHGHGHMSHPSGSYAPSTTGRSSLDGPGKSSSGGSGAGRPLSGSAPHRSGRDVLSIRNLVD